MQLVLTLLAVWVLADLAVVLVWAAFRTSRTRPATAPRTVRLPGPRSETVSRSRVSAGA